MWLPVAPYVEGAKTAREAVSSGETRGDGTGTIILWRGAKGQERIVREATSFLGTWCGEDLRGRLTPRPERERVNRYAR